MRTNLKLLTTALCLGALAYYVETAFHVSGALPPQVNLGIIDTASVLAFYMVLAIITVPLAQKMAPSPRERPWEIGHTLILIAGSLMAGALTTILLYVVPPDAFRLIHPKFFTSGSEEYITVMVPWTGILGAGFTLTWWQYRIPKKPHTKLRFIPGGKALLR